MISFVRLFVCHSNISGTAEQIFAKFARRRVWSPARTSLNVKVKGQGHQGQKMRISLPTSLGAYEWYALTANSMQQQRMAHFVAARGCFRGLACDMFGETSLALVFLLNYFCLVVLLEHFHGSK